MNIMFYICVAIAAIMTTYFVVASILEGCLKGEEDDFQEQKTD